MFLVIHYLPLPTDAQPQRPPRQDSRRDPLLDLSLLHFIINPTTTPEEERALRRLFAVRVPFSPFGPRSVA
jgi:hypothetical protein